MYNSVQTSCVDIFVCHTQSKHCIQRWQSTYCDIVDNHLRHDHSVIIWHSHGAFVEELTVGDQHSLSMTAKRFVK